jgi:lipocalin-like protein
MKIRSLLALVALAISFALPAFSQQKSLKELIVGTWSLDSIYDQTEDGKKHNPWGDDVKGQIIYTEDGHYAFMTMSANRPKADTSPRQPVGPLVAYWGTYTVDEAGKTLISDIDRCSFPQWDGEKHTTLTIETLTDDELHLVVTKPIPDPKLGPIIPHLNYKRSK